MTRDEAGDVQLMYLLTRNMNNLYGTRDRVHAAILASDWLAADRAAAEARGAERALREAAEAIPETRHAAAWLRARAARAAAARGVEGGAR